MSNLQEVNETRITLHNHEAVVETINNGIPMNRRIIIPSDLALSMLGILEDTTILSHIFREKDFDGIFEDYFKRYQMDGEDVLVELSEILNITLKYLENSEVETELLNEFYLTLVSHFDPNDFSEEETLAAFKRFMRKIYSFKDRNSVEELFKYLLEEVNLLGDVKGNYVGEVLKIILTKASNSLDKELIHSLFQVTSRVAERDWVLEVLERYIPKKKACSSPLLPKNCFIYQELLDGAKLVGIEVGAQRFDVQYHRNHFEDVGHPKMLFLFTLRGENALQCRLVCVKDNVLTPETKLYQYPFSNVHKNTDTCWPDLRKYKVKSIAHVGTLPFAFMNSANNNHLFNGVNLGEYYQSLQGKDFDGDSLIPLELSLSEWLEVNEKSL